MKLKSGVSDAFCACFVKESRTLCMSTMVTKAALVVPATYSMPLTDLRRPGYSSEGLNWLNGLYWLRGRCGL